ncbi:MAG: SusC/RagA family TonB-linked outer membrane protein [Sphingobacteriaceae bacterium]
MRKVLLAFSVLFTAIFSVQAQTRQITGKVTDDTNEPLIGVSVNIKGSSQGATTDVSGNFRINVPSDGNPVLVFKYIGFKTREITVGTQTSITVSLQEDTQMLGEVVVNVGYGTQKRRDLTGTISSISGETLTQAPVSSAAEALTGRLPGVQVTTVDGAPGAEIVIRVRGGGSITQDNSPLYIVDGFPVNSINDIAPSDIESIDVLKDASSSAIYGARGANGVVIVTTKSAKSGKTNITYSGFGQARTLPNKLDVLPPYEYVLANYEYARLRSDAEVTTFNRYFGAYDDLELYKNQQGTDWQDELFGSASLSQQHNVNITGGTEKTKLGFSISNNKDEGIMLNSGYQRTYLNLKLNHQISPSLKLDLASRFSNTVVDGAGTSGTSQVRISDGLVTRPVNGIADAIEIDPQDAAGGDDYEDFLRSLINPTELAKQDYRNKKDQTFNLNSALNWNIIKNLAFRTELGIDLKYGRNKRFYGPLTSLARNEGLDKPVADLNTNRGNGIRFANTLNYNFKYVKDHSFNVMLGQELITNNGTTQSTRAKYFDDHLQPDVVFSNFTLGTVDEQSTFEDVPNKLFSFFGRVNYNYKGKYLLTLTGRADGSSKFAPGNQWGFFPAASAAWRIADEDFMDNLDFVDDLKLRVSYGEAGNNRIADNLWRRTYKIESNRPIGFGDQAQPYWTAASSTLINPDLRWETTITRNMGLDFRLFNKLSGTLDFYHNTTKDLLVESVIPSYLGYSRQQQNIGQTSNQGIELGLSAPIIDKKDFSLSLNFNIGTNKSKIDKLDGVEERAQSSNWASTDLRGGSEDYKLIVGKTIGLMYGFVTDGFYTVDDFQSNSGTTYVLKDGVTDIGSFLGGISLRPGVLKLKDLNNDGEITADDRTIIGNALPKHSGGFGLNTRFKGLEFSAFFNWVYGNDIYNTGKIQFNQFYRTTYGNMLNTSNSENRYKYINGNGELVTDLAELAELNKNATIWSPFSSGNASPVFHSWAVEDGSFIRLNNITLGYNLPKSLISRFKMSQFRLYGTIYNAFVLSKYSGYDPEVSTTRNSSYAQLTPGVDYSAYPKSRTFTLGLNVTF